MPGISWPPFSGSALQVATNNLATLWTSVPSTSFSVEVYILIDRISFFSIGNNEEREEQMKAARFVGQIRSLRAFELDFVLDGRR
ncbi:hypothetical protein GE061_003661 [Apolygus lucorum]|uniref:Uncharacterized protein n=1 Tax=Apolygus lucorum TaxID=248454 RepID=A0A8S9X2R9_APOLU|nr:hypothetical protein GE061_003661 [Apolygus lucorum]